MTAMVGARLKWGWHAQYSAQVFCPAGSARLQLSGLLCADFGRGYDVGFRAKLGCSHL
jgi:hypothetical protein